MSGSKEKRGKFTSNLGFVMAAAGSAVGLGNIWRFPYLAAKYGGGTFLIVYILLAVTFGFSLMLAEISIGRKTGLSCIGAFEKLDKRFKLLGIVNAFVPAIIFPYYCVIGGWVTKYATVFITGSDKKAAGDSYFGGFISSTASPLIFFIIFIGVTTAIIILGVQNGIEKASTVLMPILVVLTLGVSIYSMTIKGAMGGVKYYLTPHMNELSVKCILAAVGQLFYSLSLAMGIMITYGSYMKKDTKLAVSVRQIDFFDTLIAFLAGMMIIPAVFAFSGGDRSAMNAGPGLMFITLPKVFESMNFGRVFGAVFFVLVFFAALTSSISLEETVVSVIMDKYHVSRIKAIIWTNVIAVVIGVMCSLGYGALGFVKIAGMQILDFLDFTSNSVIMPIVSIGICIFVGYFIKPKAIADEVTRNGETFTEYKLFYVMIKIISPIFLIGILISSILNSLGIITM